MRFAEEGPEPPGYIRLDRRAVEVAVVQVLGMVSG
jgi:hypothetical protein